MFNDGHRYYSNVVTIRDNGISAEAKTYRQQLSIQATFMSAVPVIILIRLLILMVKQSAPAN